MFDFVAAAVASVPGVRSCRLVAGEVPEEKAPEGGLKIEIYTLKKSYGCALLEIGDREVFDEFEAAVHNLTSSVAQRLENLDYQSFLERRVREQTAELAASKRFLQSILDQAGDFISVIDADFTIIKANPAAADIAWRKAVEGEKCYSVYFGRDTPCEFCRAKEALSGDRPGSVTAPYPDASCPDRWFDISFFPLADDKGSVSRVVEMGRDITRIQQLRNDLERSVEEKELLLREIHHRVKNNLNMAASLLSLQFADSGDEGVQELVSASVERIHSMSLVHEFLYRSDLRGA